LFELLYQTDKLAAWKQQQRSVQPVFRSFPLRVWLELPIDDGPLGESLHLFSRTKKRTELIGRGSYLPSPVNTKNYIVTEDPVIRDTHDKGQLASPSFTLSSLSRCFPISASRLSGLTWKQLGPPGGLTPLASSQQLLHLQKPRSTRQTFNNGSPTPETKDARLDQVSRASSAVSLSLGCFSRPRCARPVTTIHLNSPRTSLLTLCGQAIPQPLAYCLPVLSTRYAPCVL
jgi:hypothetical protein